MKYNEKRSLYESIMKDVAKVVKRHLNENNTSLSQRRQQAIETLTLDDFYDPEHNKAFQRVAPNVLSVSGNKISYTMDLNDEDGELIKSVTITRNTFGDLLYAITFLISALIQMKNNYYDFDINKSVYQLKKKWAKVVTNGTDDKIDDKSKMFAKILDKSSNPLALIEKFCKKGEF